MAAKSAQHRPGPGRIRGKFDGAWPPIVASNRASSDTVQRGVARGELRKLASRLYTPDQHAAPEELVRRHLVDVVAAYFPGAVIGDRSALTPGFVASGSLFLVHTGADRNVALPGLTLRGRSGPGPLASDIRFGPTDLYLASEARALIENQLPSRARSSVRRRLTREEVEEYLDRVLRAKGEAHLGRLVDTVPAVAAELGLPDQGTAVQMLIRDFLGTQEVKPTSQVLRARHAHRPYDPDRLPRFHALTQSLLARGPAPFPVDPAEQPEFPFYEAYFSNFIEGTEFDLDEARQIVTEQVLPPSRPADAHDVLSTYEIVSDLNEMARVPRTAQELEEMLVERHRRLMAWRPEKRPGLWKMTANRAGSTTFVRPEMVRGTLAEGFAIGASLTAPLDRATYLGFLVAEVHPFDDGNGRLARIMMNAELVAASEQRLVIPIAYRENYLQALRALSHNGRAQALVSVIDWAQRYSARVDWSDYQRAREDMERTGAFTSAVEMERRGLRLRLPNEVNQADDEQGDR
jgi:hypothetical protein